MHFMSTVSTIGRDKVPWAVREAVQNLEQVLIEKRGFTADIRNTNVVQGFYTCNELEHNSSSVHLCLSVSSWSVSAFTLTSQMLLKQYTSPD